MPELLLRSRFLIILFSLTSTITTQASTSSTPFLHLHSRFSANMALASTRPAWHTIDPTVFSIDTVRSLKEGQWADPSMWSTKKVPTVNDEVLLSHAVTIPSGILAEGKSLSYVATGQVVFEDSSARLQIGSTASSTQLKLKTIQGGTVNTTYTYDSQNRLVALSKADGGQAAIAYGDPEKKYVYSDTEINYTYYVKFPVNQSQGEITRYPLVFDGTFYKANTYPLYNNKIYSAIIVRYVNYSFDANKHLSSIYRYSSGPTGDNYTYQFTGENITNGYYSYSGGHAHTGPLIYTYDKRINPFYGSLDPDVGDLQQFSLNNVVSIINTETNPQTVMATYEYTYNSHGLPTKRTRKQGNTVTEVLTFTYEQ